MTQNNRGYLLDTNVVSEGTKLRANPSVVAFMTSQRNSSSAFISTMTLAELRLGAALPGITNTVRGRELTAWIDVLEQEHFADRLIGVDAATSAVWGKLMAERTRPIIDTFLAATAIVHDLTLVTRNDRDFDDIHVRLLNPWKHINS